MSARKDFKRRSCGLAFPRSTNRNRLAPHPKGLFSRKHNTHPTPVGGPASRNFSEFLVREPVRFPTNLAAQNLHPQSLAVPHRHPHKLVPRAHSPLAAARGHRYSTQEYTNGLHSPPFVEGARAVATYAASLGVTAASARPLPKGENCHSEHSEESMSPNRRSFASLRMTGFAQDDSFDGFS